MRAADRPKAKGPRKLPKRPVVVGAWFKRIVECRLVYVGITAGGVCLACFDWFDHYFPDVVATMLTRLPSRFDDFMYAWMHPLDPSRTFMDGVVEAFAASLWFAWTVYLHRVWIRRLFQRPLVRVLGPMSISMSPIIFGREKDIWDESGVNLELDFSATGSSALEDLRAGNCAIAIAGDYTICSFLNGEDYPKSQYKVVPFAVLQNQVKLLAPKEHIRAANGTSRHVTLADFREASLPPGAVPEEPPVVAYWPDSIHAEFVIKEKIKCSCSNGAVARQRARNKMEDHDDEQGAAQNGCTNASASEDETERNDPLINFMSLTASGEAAACIMVEPYFIAFQSADYEVLLQANDMSWYMCLVMKEELLTENPDLEKRLMRAITKACAAAHKNWEDAMISSAHYMLREFTGIDEKSLMAHIPKKHVTFRTLQEGDENFLARLRELKGQEYGEAIREGATIMQVAGCVIYA